MTPSDVEVLMHCHFIAGPHPRLHAPAVQQAIQRFLKDGVIKPDVRRGAPEGSFSTTERGVAWVEAICATPCPTVGDPLMSPAMEERRTTQQDLNVRWLIDKIDKIHEALCPGEFGTWQERAKQAVAAALKIAGKKGEGRDCGDSQTGT